MYLKFISKTVVKKTKKKSNINQIIRHLGLQGLFETLVQKTIYIVPGGEQSNPIKSGCR